MHLWLLYLKHFTIVFSCKGKEHESYVFNIHSSACSSMRSHGVTEARTCRKHHAHQTISEEDDDENDEPTNYVKSDILFNV